MIRLNLGSKFESELVNRVLELNNHYESTGARISEVYGTHHSFRGVISDVRECFRNKGIDLSEFQNSVTDLRVAGIDVNYVMNSPVIGENYIANNHKRIISTINELKDIGVNIITTPVIQLGELIKKHVPDMQIYLSTVADVRHPSELDDVKHAGIDRVIPSFFVNRDFDFLKYANEINQPVELLLQSTCRFNCIRRKNHAVSEALMETKPKDPAFRDYHVRSCASQFNKEFPNAFLMSPWILPEDLEKYNNVCADTIFKINGRTLSIDEKLFITECYLRRSSPKNLGNLFAATTSNSIKEGNKFKKIFIPTKELRQPIEYHGTQYDGFTDFFFQENPNYKKSLDFCNYIATMIKDKSSFGVKTGFKEEPGIEKYNSLKNLD